MKRKLSREWLKFDKNINLQDINQKIPTEILEKVVNHYMGNVNLDNKEFVSFLISEMPFPMFSPREFLSISKKVTNPTNKRGASKRSASYWMARGWSEEDAKEIVSSIQRKNSPRCTDYWVSRGVSFDEAKACVAKVQSKSAIEYHSSLKDRGEKHLTCFGKAYWVKRGFSESEAKELSSSVQRSNSMRNLKKYTKEERNKQRPSNLSYWLSRGKSVEDYERYMSESRFCSYNSKIAREFCLDLRECFLGNKIYCVDKEFGKYIPDYGYVRYDYVDLTLKVVVEFNGEYWHSSEDAKAHDKRKKDFVESLGFRYFVVTDREYNTDRKECVKQISERIRYDN